MAGNFNQLLKPKIALTFSDMLPGGGGGGVKVHRDVIHTSGFTVHRDSHNQQSS